MNKKSFESGNEYTLAHIFSGENKIVIPDLQRDYCWGGKIYDKEKKTQKLVPDFLTSLIDLYKNNRQDKFTLGMIYGYEDPKLHIQLCDGQQRITTLFLLLGILNRKTDGKFKKYLISNIELTEDDKRPYLQYAIRDSTLYFLSDLVCEFFLKKDIDINKIKKQSWYFDEYNLDASIISMIEALIQIEKRLTIETDLDIADFGDFIITNLQMLYYDVGNRVQGEETFVVINTSGEPLTPTENLKPIFINKLPLEKQQEASKSWEEWETFFWKNRRGNGSKNNDTANKGFLEFFRWIILLSSDDENILDSIITNGKLNIDDLRLTDIQRYFNIVKFAFMSPEIFWNDRDWLTPDDINDQIVWLRILPVIEYIKRFGEDDMRSIIQVKKFFKNISRNRNVSRDIAQMLPLAIRIIKELPSKDIADIIFMKNISKTLLTDEERLKFNLYKKAQNRLELENLFWEKEDHKIWNGEIMPILEWSGGNNFDLDLFKRYSNVFSILFHGNMDYEKLEITRRALLTRNLSQYPRIFNGYTNYSFCWRYSDWKTLINDNKYNFKLFFDELLDKNEDDIYHELNKMIQNNPSNKDYDEFVKIPELLTFCKEKNIQWGGEQGWILIQGSKRSGAHANLKSYRLFIDLKNSKFINNKNWELNFFPYYDTCCYFNNEEKDLAIDLFFSKNINDIDYYRLLLFKRIKKEKGKEELQTIAEKHKLSWQEKTSEDYYRYESLLFDKESILNNLQNIINDIENNPLIND
ncbi:MAG: DUF262 domain-containing protein [Bacteroidales bacterium]|nr:DUF262 domain-containing protein [Bacteroidales bacterium]